MASFQPHVPNRETGLLSAFDMDEEVLLNTWKNAGPPVRH